MDAAFEATPFASGTFMWQYIYETLRAGHSHDEEVVMAMTMTMVPTAFSVALQASTT